MRVARFKILDNQLCSSTGPSTATVTSSGVDVSYSNGYFSLKAVGSSAGTSQTEWYYQTSDDKSTFSASALITAAAAANGTSFIEGFDPPVCKFIRIVGIGTGTNAPSSYVSAKLLFTEDSGA